MIYKINEKPKTLKETLLYAAQQTLSVLTATLLISGLCGTDIAAGMIGAGAATLVFLVLTKFKAPLFFSNSGSTVSAVQGALIGIAGSYNYAGVIIGGIVICMMNLIAAAITKKLGSGWVNKLLPPVVSGTIVIVIGLHLATFCDAYIKHGNYEEMATAFVSMYCTVYTMRYGKGIWKTLPFLCGAAGGAVMALVFNLWEPIEWSWFSNPQIAIFNSDFSQLDLITILGIIASFAAVNLANLGEHISDVIAVSSVVEEDLTETVGLDKTFAGDGIADLVGCLIGGQPTTTYSESLSTISVSGVASTFVIAIAAIMLMALGLFGPFTAIVNAIPNCVFGGVALVAYGMIAKSGFNTLKEVNIATTKNSIIIAVMLTVGVSGIAFTTNLTGIVLSMIVGLILNLVIDE